MHPHANWFNSRLKHVQTKEMAFFLAWSKCPEKLHQLRFCVLVKAQNQSQRNGCQLYVAFKWTVMARFSYFAAPH